MRRASSITPFEFQSDFAPPKADTPDRVEMSVADFMSYLSQARAEGLMEGRAGVASEEASRMEAAADNLNAALSDLVKLAEYLEVASGTDGTPDEVRALIKSAAQRLVDGQGDLFTASLRS